MKKRTLENYPPRMKGALEKRFSLADMYAMESGEMIEYISRTNVHHQFLVGYVDKRNGIIYGNRISGNNHYPDSYVLSQSSIDRITRITKWQNKIP